MTSICVYVIVGTFTQLGSAVLEIHFSKQKADKRAAHMRMFRHGGWEHFDVEEHVMEIEHEEDTVDCL